MKIEKLDQDNEKKLIDEAVGYLNLGKIVVLPTDTIYGLHCLSQNKKGIEKIFKIKNKNTGQSLINLVASINMAKKFCRINKHQEAYVKKLWSQKNSVTAIFESRGKLVQGSEAKDLSISVRLPKSDFLIKIIRRLNKPIVSTSLNMSGKKNLEFLDNLDKYFQKLKPDFAVDVGKISAKSSQIIDLRDINNIKFIRK